MVFLLLLSAPKWGYLLYLFFRVWTTLLKNGLYLKLFMDIYINNPTLHSHVTDCKLGYEFLMPGSGFISVIITALAWVQGSGYQWQSLDSDSECFVYRHQVIHINRVSLGERRDVGAVLFIAGEAPQVRVLGRYGVCGSISSVIFPVHVGEESTGAVRHRHHSAEELYRGGESNDKSEILLHRTADRS